MRKVPPGMRIMSAGLASASMSESEASTDDWVVEHLDANRIHTRARRIAHSGRTKVEKGGNLVASQEASAAASEFDGHADQGAVDDEVEVVGEGTAICEVDVRRQRPVADIGGERVSAELPRVAVDGGNLPGELAAARKAEATDIAFHESMLVGRELVAQPEPDHGIGPVQRPAVGDADCLAAIELGEAGIREGNCAG